MRVINVLLLFLLSFNANSSNDLSELDKCGIKLDGYISGKNNNFFELNISIDQSIEVSESCTEISVFSVSNHSENEFMIMDVINKKLGVTLLFNIENANNSNLSFTGGEDGEFMLMEDADNGYIIWVSELISHTQKGKSVHTN